MIWSECKEIWEEGPREYAMHLWNLLDFGMLSIFVASFTARFMAFLKATEAQHYVDEHVQDDDLNNVTLPPEYAYFTYGKIILLLNVVCSFWFSSLILAKFSANNWVWSLQKSSLDWNFALICRLNSVQFDAWTTKTDKEIQKIAKDKEISHFSKVFFNSISRLQ